MGVNLGRDDIRMTEERLDCPQVGAPREQVGGERMQQPMGMDVPRQPRAPRLAPHELPDHLACPRLAARAMKDEPEGLAVARGGLGLEVRLEMAERHLSDRDDAPLAALTVGVEHAAGEVEIAPPQPDQLRHPKARRVHQAEHGAIAQAARLIDVGGVDQRHHLLDGQRDLIRRSARHQAGCGNGPGTLPGPCSSSGT